MSDTSAEPAIPPNIQPEASPIAKLPPRPSAKRSLARRAASRLMRAYRTGLHHIAFRRRYMGFRMPYFYSPAYDQLPENVFWEPELTAAILQELNRIGRQAPVVLDVGANAGFVTLNVLSRFPRARVFAFEPGPGQQEVLSRIVRHNRLDNVTVVPLALGTEAGTAEFVTHHGVDDSGLDGFRDTRAIQGGRVITVPVQTLDQWWQSAGRPAPDLIKIDTEGSELIVLRSGEELIRSCRPVLALEIWPSHIACYPYTLQDLLDWLDAREYGLFTFDGRRVATVDEPKAFGHEMNFLAKSLSGREAAVGA